MLNPVEKLLVRHGLPIVFDICKLAQLDFGEDTVVEVEHAYNPPSYCIRKRDEELRVLFMDGSILSV
jgi:hypothetical protein